MRNRARLALVAVVTMAGPLAAQRQRETAFWMAVGVGAGSPQPYGSVDVYGAYNYQRGASLFTLRTATALDVAGALLVPFGGSSRGVSDIGLLYGRATRPDHRFAGVSAGIGLAQVSRDTAGVSHKTYHLTLPLEGQVAWRPVRYIAFMLLGFASLNRGRSFEGLTVGVQLGRLY
jgi:hypothetical protein